MCFSFAKHWVFKTSNHVTSLYSEGKIKLICLRTDECGIHLSNQLMNSNLLYSPLKEKKKNRLKKKTGWVAAEFIKKKIQQFIQYLL